ncbi:MAG TPA: archease [Acidimicrobiales bacterium]|nr:archease [Acidimicrobiales bacterium]
METGNGPDDLPGDRGFRLAPQTPGHVLEAWGPDRVTCLAEAVGALVSVFADLRDTATTTTLPIVLEPAPTPDLLVGLLEEVIDTVDVFGKVPVHVHLAEAEDGGMAGDLEVVEVAEVVLVGPVPKAVSWHGLEVGEDGGTWRCRVVVGA